jgi:outer membrane receptor protein involved in Fe transport
MVVASAPPVLADDVADEADLEFDLGADAYAKKNFAAALEHFLISNRLVPNRNVVFNIARAYEQLNRSSDAYRYYLVAREGEKDPGALGRINEALARIAPQVAALRVTSDPPGATIYVDRKELGGRGNTPRALALPPGKHTVFVELPGYRPAPGQDVELKIGTEVPVALKLTQIVGRVIVRGMPGAQIRVDREDVASSGVVPADLALPPGRHTLFLSLEGYEPSATVVDVPQDGVVSTQPVMRAQTGVIVVNADIKDALVSVDDRAVGASPAVAPVTVGRHTVRVTQTGFRPVEQSVQVKAGEESKVDVEMSAVEEVNAASRASETVEDAPASVTIISRQELRAMGYPTIADALRGIRGMYVTDDHTYVSAGIRGFGNPGNYGNGMLVMIDGQPTNDNYIWASYIDFSGRVDLDDIERIEVVRGPGSVLYGTGALFGVINLVTRDRNTPTKSEVALSAVDANVIRARATQVYRVNDHAGAWSSVSVAQGSGRDYYFPELRSDPRSPMATLDASGLPADGNVRGADGMQAITIGGRGWYKALTAQWFFTSRKKTIPSAEYGTIIDDTRMHFADTRGFFEVRFEPQVSKSVQLLTRAHLNLYNFDDLIPYPASAGGSSHDTYRGKWGGVEQRVVYTPTPTFKLTIGGETIRHFETKQIGASDAGNASYILDDKGNPVPSRNDPFTEAAGYVMGDMALTRAVKISAGARLDYYENLKNPSLAGLLNPRLAVILKPYAGGNLKIMGGKAFRTPSVYELHFSSITQLEPPSNISPEQAYSGEVEWTHHISKTVTGLLAAYANYATDTIRLENVTLPTGTFQQYQNSSTPIRGLGAEAEIRREWRNGWMLSASYTYLDTEYVGGLGGPGYRAVPNAPNHLAGVKGAIPIIGRTLMAMSRVTVEGQRPDRDFRPTDPAQTTSDAAVIWDVIFSGEVERMGLQYSVGVYNASDWRYYAPVSTEFTMTTIVQPGRTFLASMSAAF